MATDPFTIAFNGLWAAVKAGSLGSLIKVGNQIELVTEGELKVRVSNADAPELVLLPVSGDANIHYTSCSSKIVRQFVFYISTGDQRVRTELFPIEFALFRALAGWQKSVSALTWEGKSFIKRVDILTIGNALQDSERNRGIERWSASWAIELEMHFGHNDLLEA